MPPRLAPAGAASGASAIASAAAAGAAGPPTWAPTAPGTIIIASNNMEVRVIAMATAHEQGLDR